MLGLRATSFSVYILSSVALVKVDGDDDDDDDDDDDIIPFNI